MTYSVCTVSTQSKSPRANLLGVSAPVNSVLAQPHDVDAPDFRADANTDVVLPQSQTAAHLVSPVRLLVSLAKTVSLPNRAPVKSCNDLRDWASDLKQPHDVVPPERRSSPRTVMVRPHLHWQSHLVFPLCVLTSLPITLSLPNVVPTKFLVLRADKRSRLKQPHELDAPLTRDHESTSASDPHEHLQFHLVRLPETFGALMTTVHLLNVSPVRSREVGMD